MPNAPASVPVEAVYLLQIGWIKLYFLKPILENPSAVSKPPFYLSKNHSCTDPVRTPHVKNETAGDPAVLLSIRKEHLPGMTSDQIYL